MILEPNCGGLLARNPLQIILLSQMIPPGPPTLFHATHLAGKLAMSWKIFEKGNKDRPWWLGADYYRLDPGKVPGVFPKGVPSP